MPNSSIRQAAQAASAGQTRSADVEVFCLDSTRPINSWERSQLVLDAPRRVIVVTKIDAPAEEEWIGDWQLGISRSGDRDFPIPNPQSPLPSPPVRPAVATSSVTGDGIERLRKRLGDALLGARRHGREVVAGTAVRCHESLRRAADSLKRARGLAATSAGEELAAAELRGALEELGRVVGAVCADDLLDRIFSRFCIGK